jgi:DNA-binding XRE family transcriptional regulator
MAHLEASWAFFGGRLQRPRLSKPAERTQMKDTSVGMHRARRDISNKYHAANTVYHANSMESIMDHVHEMMDVLRAGRYLVNLNQDELAKRANVSRKMIVNIEAKKIGTPIDAIEAVRQALEKAGVGFISSTSEMGPGIALKRKPRGKRTSA